MYNYIYCSTKVMAVVITSSPLRLSATHDKCKPAVQEFKATASRYFYN